MPNNEIDLKDENMSNGLNRFLGDTPLRVAVKLLVFSLVAGVIMSVVGWSPRDIFSGIANFFRRLWELGFDAIFSSLEYLILGAAIVIPAFFIIRVFSYRSGSRD